MGEGWGEGELPGYGSVTEIVTSCVRLTGED